MNLEGSGAPGGSSEASAPDGGPVAGKPQARLSRRNLLGGVATSGIGIAALGTLAGAIASSTAGASETGSSSGSTSGAKHQWAMVIDLRLCNGCKQCTTACQTAHYLHQDQTWIKVFTMRDSNGQTYPMPRPCMMCEDPPCIPVCPVSANFRTEEGLTLVDQHRCIGTRICMNACPYEARYFNWSDPVPAPRQPFPQEPQWPVPQVKGTVGKCIYCAAMLPSGKLPECVQNCPMGAI